MIVWFPIVKLIVSVLALWLASAPIRKHVAAHKAESRAGWRIKDATYLPTSPGKYIPLALVILLIVMTPFRLQSPQQLETTVRTYDAPILPSATVERKARPEYTPDNNEETIKRILKKEQTQ